MEIEESVFGISTLRFVLQVSYFELSLIQSFHPFKGMIVWSILSKRRFHNIEMCFGWKLPWILSKDSISFIIVIIQSRNSIYGVYSNTFYRNRVGALEKCVLPFLLFYYYYYYCCYYGWYEMGALTRNELKS